MRFGSIRFIRSIRFLVVYAKGFEIRFYKNLNKLFYQKNVCVLVVHVLRERLRWRKRMCL